MPPADRPPDLPPTDEPLVELPRAGGLAPDLLEPQVAPGSDPPRAPVGTLSLVGHAHIDPVWLWQWQEGFAEIKATWRSALDRLREYPEARFSASSAAFYEWVEQNEPAMFREIQQRVAEGRWELAGGWWVEPDCNIPSGESFVRHGLYGQRWFLSRFGRTAAIAFNPDAFGHHIPTRGRRGPGTHPHRAGVPGRTLAVAP